MKGVFLSYLIIVLSVISGFSQGISFLHEDQVMGEESACTSFYIHSGVINLTEEEQVIIWERLENNVPCDWQSSVYDSYITFPPSENSHYFTLTPGDTMPLSINFFPFYQEAMGSVVLRVFLESDPSVSDTLSYVASGLECEDSSPCVLVIECPAEPKILVFPNPTSDHIHLMGTLQSSDLYLIDMSGKRVKSYPDFLNGRIDISDLPKGIYTLILSNKIQDFKALIIKE